MSALVIAIFYTIVGLLVAIGFGFLVLTKESEPLNDSKKTNI